MECSGGGVTFDDNDLVMAKRIWGLLSSVKFSLDVQQTVQAAEALKWYTSLAPMMENNILEIKKISKASDKKAE